MSLQDKVLANTTPPQLNQIQSNQNLSAGLPHDIVGLSDYPLRISILHIAIVALITLLLLWFLYRRFFKTSQGPKKKKELHPLLKLEKDLLKLKPQRFTSSKEQEEYFYQLNLIFRSILEHAYDFPATDLTLKELYQPIKNKVDFDPDEITNLLKFFERCELIKFAKAESSYLEAEKFYHQSVDWSEMIIKKALTPPPSPSAKTIS